MTPIKNINIPQACHQSWQQMTEANEGRHCESCCKTVVDFTAMSNDEIINYLSAKTHVCGRFQPQQLNSINYKLYAENLVSTAWWKRLAVGISMLAPLSFHKANAQTKPAIANVADTTHNNSGPVSNDHIVGKVIAPNLQRVSISGTVLAKDDGLPIPGVTIKLKGTNFGTQTNTAGKFTLSVPRYGTILVASFVGYTNQEIAIKNNEGQPLKIEMQSNSVMMGEIVITKTIYRRPKNMWIRVKNSFGTHSEIFSLTNYASSRNF